MFAFGFVLLTIHVRPYREKANNQLVSLTTVNVFLFLFTCVCASRACLAWCRARILI
jgi:uncharacterized membrane protein YidH (DUF202 family)